MKGIYVNRRTGEQDLLYIEIHFEEKKKEEIEILDEDIQQEYDCFFEYLKDSSYVYGEEEMLTYMKAVLAEYRERN